MTTTETEFKISEEPLAERVLRQMRSGTLDESRLLPSAGKRARDVGKKLDRLASRQGWYTFMAAQAYAMAAGKAPLKRNAEIMAVEQVMQLAVGGVAIRARSAGGVRRADRGGAEQPGPGAKGRTSEGRGSPAPQLHRQVPRGSVGGEGRSPSGWLAM